MAIITTIGCIELGGKIKKVHFTYWLTLFSLYFLILRLISFLAFFDLRLPSFANLNFCLLMGIRQNFNGKLIDFEYHIGTWFKYDRFGFKGSPFQFVPTSMWALPVWWEGV